MYFDDFGGKRQ